MLGALAAGAAQVGLSAWQSAKNIGMQRETNDLNYRMWQQQLDYDRPVNQVARLKEAGLNPALMYGTGSGANTAPNPVQAQAPRGDARLDPGFAVAMQQSRLLAEQARGLKLENDATEATPGARRGDTAVTRGIRDVVEKVGKSPLMQHVGPTMKQIGNSSIGNLINDAKSFWKNKFREMTPKQGWFSGPDNGYVKPWNRRKK